ncbi:MAG: domain containing protein [Firmicutes bacterium]|nr:domain containing protein [Bacillota bacterium]
MFVRNLENFLEKYIEGFFNQKFSSGLQTVEIFKRLEKEMYFKKQSKNNEIQVPNVYTIYLSEFDYHKLYSEQIVCDLSEYISQTADTNNYKIISAIVVKCHCDKKLKKGCFYIELEYHEDDLLPQKEVEESMNTIVFQKEKLCNSSNIHSSLKLATLTIIEGLDAGIKLDIANNRVNIGRRKTNELPLTDINTSRLHAYIICEECKHVIYDANSLNGMFINGRHIDKCMLNNGDKIKLGSTVILYEVK